MAGLGAGLWDRGTLAQLPRAQILTDAPASAADHVRAAREGWALSVARARLQPSPRTA